MAPSFPLTVPLCISVSLDVSPSRPLSLSLSLSGCRSLSPFLSLCISVCLDVYPSLPLFLYLSVSECLSLSLFSCDVQESQPSLKSSLREFSHQVFFGCSIISESVSFGLCARLIKVLSLLCLQQDFSSSSYYPPPPTFPVQRGRHHSDVSDTAAF